MSKETKSFEASLKKLDAIARKLESDDVSLEESLALFEEGVTLVKFLQAKLNEAERKVEMLVKETDGTFRLAEFPEEDSE